MALEAIEGGTLPREGTVKPAQPAQEQPKPAEPPEQWRDEFKKTVEQRDSFKNQVKQQSEELQRLRAFQNEVAEKDKAMKERLENEKLLADGKYQELIGKKELEAKARYEGLQAKVAERLIPSAIMASAAKIPNLTKEALQDLPLLLKESLAIDDVTLQIKVVGADGQALKDANGQDMDPEAYIAGFVASRPYLLVDQMPKRIGVPHGLGQPGQQPAPSSYEEHRQAWEKDPQGYAAKMAEEFSPANMMRMAREKAAKK